MSRLLVGIGLMVAASIATAQPRTLVSGEVSNGAAGIVAAQTTKLDGHVALLVGGGGEWTIGHVVSIGGVGYGLVTEVEATALDHYGRPLLMNLGYGGLIVEVIAAPDEVLHLRGGFTVGFGSVGYREDIASGSGYWRDWGEWQYTAYGSEGFYVLEPTLAAELNVAKWIRVSLGVSYRHVWGIDQHDVEFTDQQISAASALLAFRMGSF